MDQVTTLQGALEGRYAVEKEIGAGGMATVFLAQDLRHERKVAIKVLKPELGAVLGAERFLAEIRVTAQLQHPNLLPLFDSGAADGLLYYVMPFVDGETLRARLLRERQLPVDEAVAVTRAIGSALDYAHAHHVIHRDLKPENILFQAGEPVLADFGIALAVANAGGERVTQTGLSLGTPQYMSPEQATGDRVIDGRTDIYSLAAVLYEMLTGEPPHTGATAQAIIARLLTDKPRSVRASRDSVPAHVEAAIERALAKLPADRFATAKEFGQALAGAGGSTASIATGGSPDRFQVAFAIPKRTMVRAARIAGVAVAVMLGVWGWLRTPERPSHPHIRFAVEPPDNLSFLPAEGQQSVQIAPDGSEVLLPVRGSAGRILYRRRLDDLEATLVPGTELYMNPRYDPSGAWIGLEYENGALVKLSLRGGSPVHIADSVARPNWGEKDVIVFQRGVSLWHVNANGGAPIRLTTPDSSAGERVHTWPHVLPGATAALFNISAGGPIDESEVAVVRLSDGSVTKLGIKGTNPRYVSSGHLLTARQSGTISAVPFDPVSFRVMGLPVPVLEGVVVKTGGAGQYAVSTSGTLVYFRSQGGGGRPAIRNDAGRLEMVEVPAGTYVSPRFSPDGKRIALTRVEYGRSDVWVYNRATNQALRLTRDGKSKLPAWSADGTRVLWLYGDSAGPVVRLQQADGTGTPETIGLPDPNVLNFTIAPDGKFLAVVDGPTGRRDITLVPLDAASQPRALAGKPETETAPGISPDSRWLTFTTSESGRNEIYVSSVENPATRVQVTMEGASQPAWMPDGTRLVYRTAAHFMTATLSFSPRLEVIRRDTLFADSFLRSGEDARDYDVGPTSNEFLLLNPVNQDLERPIVVTGWVDELRERMAPAKRP